MPTLTKISLTLTLPNLSLPKLIFDYRWQLTKGLRDKAAVTLRDIAKINKRPEPKDLEKRLGTIIIIFDTLILGNGMDLFSTTQ
jgi:hypothetical protein